jgi:hypothetical protein
VQFEHDVKVDRDVRVWIDPGGGITIRAADPSGDPVEISSGQARDLAEVLLRFAESTTRSDEPGRVLGQASATTESVSRSVDSRLRRRAWWPRIGRNSSRRAASEPSPIEQSEESVVTRSLAMSAQRVLEWC